MNVPKKLTTTRNILFIILLTFMSSCKKPEHNTDEDFKISNTENLIKKDHKESNAEQTEVKEDLLDNAERIYRYVTVNGEAVQAETEVLFVDRKKDELQITINMPNIMNSKFNLVKQKSLGLINGIETYEYISPADNNKQVRVFFDKGCKMMGMTLDKQNYVFMNNTTTEQIDNKSTVNIQKKLYRYTFVRGQIIEQETVVVFVNGKKHIQVTINSNNGQTFEFNLVKPVSLGVHDGLDTYMYKSTTDNNKEIMVFFSNGIEMMGMTIDKESFVFIDNPNFKK